MKYVVIEISDPAKEYVPIKDALALYDIYPLNIGNWNTFNYLLYNPEWNAITNYSSDGIVLRDYIRCCSWQEFVDVIRRLIREKKKEFVKGNLKPGMVVECKNGSRYLVVNNFERKFLLGKTNYCSLDNYNDNLEHLVGDFDIIKIYFPKYTGNLDFILKHASIDSENLIWEKEGIKEVTLKEVADKFGGIH